MHPVSALLCRGLPGWQDLPAIAPALLDPPEPAGVLLGTLLVPAHANGRDLNHP